MRSSGSNLGRIFKGSDYQLAPTTTLEEEFFQGRVPVFLWQTDFMSHDEKNKFSDDMWITKKLCHEPLHWSLQHKKIGGLHKISFDIGRERRQRDVLDMFDRHLQDMSLILKNLITICTSTRIKRSELDVMAESLFILRLAGDENEYPFSKLCSFDQGIVHLNPIDIFSCTQLRRFIREKRKDVYARIIESSVSIMNRFLATIDEHPQFPQYKKQVLLWQQSKRYQSP